MNQWRTPLGGIAIILWCLLCAAVWSGCGAGDYSYEIVNGYELHGDTPWACITYPDGGDVGDFAIGELGLERHIIYGERYTTDMHGVHNGYFIIDTSTDDVQVFGLNESGEWVRHLSELGVHSIDMRWSSALWKVGGIGTFLWGALFVILLGVVLFVLFVIVPSERKKRRLELDRL
jgi:hypothetical protein